MVTYVDMIMSNKTMPPRPSNPVIPTRKELLQLIAARENDPNTPELKLNPPWLLDSNDEQRRSIRQRERRIRKLTLRLDKPTREMEQEFDLNA